MRIIPEPCIALLVQEEGCVLAPYRDTAGLMTIGIGHLIKPTESFPGPITRQAADDLLRADLAEAANTVMLHATVPLNDNQFSALISFTINTGGGALQGSSLLRYINSGGTDPNTIAADFAMWCKDHDPRTGQLVVVPGLVTRRAREAALYNTPID